MSDDPLAPVAPPITLPARLQGVEAVERVRTPLRLDYHASSGRHMAAYLHAMKEKRILGERCPATGQVFVPPRGVTPTSGLSTTELVELPDTGYIESFCITRVPIPGRDDLELPYVSAWVVLDGASVGFLGSRRGHPARRREARSSGARRVAPRRRAAGDGRQHPPLGSDGRARRRDHVVRARRRAGEAAMTDVAVVAFAVRQEQVVDENEIEMIAPLIEEVRAATGLGPGDLDFTCSGSSDFLAGAAFSFVSTLDATRPVPPIVESHVEMDGAWALYEAWVKLQLGEAKTALDLRLREVVPRDAPRRARDTARSVRRRAALARRVRDRRPPGAGPARCRRHQRARSRHGSHALTRGRLREPEHDPKGRAQRRRAAGRAHGATTRSTPTTAPPAPTAVPR